MRRLEKGDLGIGYIGGIGVGLLGGSIGHMFLVETSLLIYWYTRAVIFALGISLVFVATWLWRSNLSTKHSWHAAKWCSGGLAVPTLLGLLFTVVWIDAPASTLVQSMFPILIATGGVIGVLIGTVLQLDDEYATTRRLAQRSSVINRVLRHNVRTEVNMIIGYADQIKHSTESIPMLADQIQDRAHRIVKMSHAVRQTERLDSDDASPIDVVSVVTERVALARETYPSVEITLNAPSAAWASATVMLYAVVDNLIENAIHHNDHPRPELNISIHTQTASDPAVVIQFEDNGPGIPRAELEVLNQESESPLSHGSGIGLWLVKWFTQAYNGSIEFTETTPRGTTIAITLPLATPPPPAPHKTEPDAQSTRPPYPLR